MRSILCPFERGSVAADRVVCLPAAFQPLEMFLEAGFDAAVRRRGAPLDLAFVDLEPRHLLDRSVLASLATTIVDPARHQGARRVWIAGISLGGYLALEYAMSEPGGWDGLCLIAPFLGSKGLIAQLSAEDAPALAPPAAAGLAPGVEERRIWEFVRHGGLAGRPCLLGYGERDRYADAHRLLERALPAAVVCRVPGGHDWPTWLALWELMLEEIR